MLTQKRSPKGLGERTESAGMGPGLSLIGGLFLAGLVVLLGIFPNLLLGMLTPW
jgi:hypothetical protein